MAQCESCSAPAELFLCRLCTTTLHDMLTSLHRHPTDARERLGLLEYLHDEAIGQRVRSDNGRHVRSEPKHLNGDVSLASLIDPFPDEKVEDLDVARNQRYQAALRRALAAGKVNAKAVDEYNKAANTLGTWVRHIAESRGVEPRPLRTVGPAFIGPVLPGWRRISSDYVMAPEEAAEWLAYNRFSVALDEAAGQLYGDIHDLVHAIEKIINPPVPIRTFAMCPTWFSDQRTACGKPLRAREDAVEVYCRSCRTTYKPEFLERIREQQLDEKLIPWDKVIAANKEQREGYRVNERTLRHWRSSGVLKPRQWGRPDGSHGNIKRTVDDVELFAWADVKKLRTESIARANQKMGAR